MRASPLLLAALVALPFPASAQTADPPESPYEHLFDDVERGDLADERRDHLQLERIVDAWDHGVAQDDLVRLRVADAQLRDWLDRELREDRMEIAESRREVEAARDEVARTGLLDDRLDLTEEHARLVRTREDLRRTQRIAKRVARLQPDFYGGTATEAQHTRKRRLLHELERLAQDELERSRAETDADREEALEQIEWRRTHEEARR